MKDKDNSHRGTEQKERNQNLKAPSPVFPVPSVRDKVWVFEMEVSNEKAKDDRR